MQNGTAPKVLGRYCGRIEGIVMKSAPSTNRKNCVYCGLQSAESPNHASIRDCVDELQREVSRLQEHMRQGKAAAPAGAPQHARRTGTPESAGH